MEYEKGTYRAYLRLVEDNRQAFHLSEPWQIAVVRAEKTESLSSAQMVLIGVRSRRRHAHHSFNRRTSSDGSEERPTMIMRKSAAWPPDADENESGSGSEGHTRTSGSPDSPET
jgi:hypothetical protein